MATLVIVQQICDVCGDGTTISGVSDITPLRVVVGKVEYEVDLCPECYGKAELLKVMRPVKKERQVKPRVLAAVAANEAEAPKKAYNTQHGSFPCLQCDFVGKTPNALGAHSRKHK
jgi:hypothetical protein